MGWNVGKDNVLCSVGGASREGSLEDPGVDEADSGHREHHRRRSLLPRRRRRGGVIEHLPVSPPNGPTTLDFEMNVDSYC
jgi:hypothetical protein